jgi:hypothetical protein
MAGLHNFYKQFLFYKIIGLLKIIQCHAFLFKNDDSETGLCFGPQVRAYSVWENL